MYEQDVKLAKLLVEKINELSNAEESVKNDLENAREELTRVVGIREERDAYLDILSEAASLLDSKDLVVENPETGDQQENVDNLEFRLEELDEERQKYNRLIDALREKAPQLFDESAAEEEEAAEEEPTEPETEETIASLEEVETDEFSDQSEGSESTEEPEDEEDDDSADSEEEPVAEILAEEEEAVENMDDTSDSDDEDEEEDHDDDDDGEDEDEAEEFRDQLEEVKVENLSISNNGHSQPTETFTVTNENGSSIDEDTAVIVEPASDTVPDVAISVEPVVIEENTTVKVAVESPERTLSRFNLDHLKKKEAFTFGRGAAYIVDGDSVLDRLPYYDFSLRGVLENQTRDELARDVDVLSTELHGLFHIVYNSQYSSSLSLGDNVSIECADGNGDKDDADARVRELVSELIAKHTCVCVITGDVALADSVRGQGIHILQLHDFFRA